MKLRDRIRIEGREYDAAFDNFIATGEDEPPLNQYVLFSAYLARTLGLKFKDSYTEAIFHSDIPDEELEMKFVEWLLTRE